VSSVDLYDYELPRELIAQQPLADRAAARLLVVWRREGRIEHRYVRDLPGILAAGDLLVVNDTRVVPARLEGRRVRTGGRWEGLFLRTLAESAAAAEPSASAGTTAAVTAGPGDWVLLAQTRGRPTPGERIMLLDREGRDAVELMLVGRSAGGAWIARVVSETVAGARDAVEVILARVGRVPLPGYIRGGHEAPGDADRYQTVFARAAGSAAAPTAGLHFTTDLLARLAAAGIGRAAVTLHVGLDTFRPITADDVEEHPMHTEWCECPPPTAAAVAATRAAGGRVVAVGTTAVRTLETAARATGVVESCRGPTDLFIRPGFTFRAVDCLLTNFHMPRTTLMVLVTTFASRELIARAYAEAIRERYRFLSYGDAMLIV
jgi:S-adenosylmethionine:tRNA ribosyltransferase-isomerase